MKGNAEENWVRRDAEEHRQSLVVAAKTVFLKQGYGAPLEAVLTAAGLGRGTLYRHFRGRVELIIAIFEDELETSVRFVEKYRAKADFLERLLSSQGAQKAPHLLALGSLSDADRKEMARALGPLMAKMEAHDDRTVRIIRETRPLRPDFDGAGLRAVYSMLAGASITFPHLPRQLALDRSIDLLLHGLLTPERSSST